MNKNLIVISAMWCTSCLIVLNSIKQIAKDFPNINIINLDYDLDADKISNYGVGNTLPVLILEDANGDEINRLIGEKSLAEIRHFLSDA